MANSITPEWDLTNIISDRLRLQRQNVRSVIKLLDSGATIPFIARYRKDETGNLEPDVLREIESNVDDLRNVESKIQSVHSSIQKLGKMTAEVEKTLRMSTSILEVDTVYAPFKPGHKGTYAERARALGLGDYANDILTGKNVNLAKAVDVNVKGLSLMTDVEKGVQYIIADIVSKDKEMTELAHSLCEKHPVMIESSQVKMKSTVKQGTKTQSSTKGKDKTIKRETPAHKFEQYFEFRMPVPNLKPHQVLALNRGEDLKILTLKLVVPEAVKEKFLRACLNKYVSCVRDAYARNLIQAACVDGYVRLIEPALVRRIRSDLTKDAEKASISVFASNLKGLMLAPPTRQKSILGIDPGFRNGCKFAVISPEGEVLQTGVAYLHGNTVNKGERAKLSTAAKAYQCTTLAIGNGQACRETEKVISDMIKRGDFAPLNVVYCIVDECGASIYSVSDQAKTEMPDLDPTLRGAVSIARRLQDPLAEFVKIEPQHLGVGMYQHDMNKSKLQKALDSVVEECVSFVGVDLNTCSECLLRRVAGLNSAKAKKILEWRSQHGRFTSRQQLIGVKGLGKKGFEQCAGFVRIMKPSHDRDDPEVIKIEDDDPVDVSRRKRKATTTGSTKSKKPKTDENYNPLDATAVHPESYDLTNRLASHLGLELSEFGSPDFRKKVKCVATPEALERFCAKENAGRATVQLIAQALEQPLAHDIRENFQKPLFKQEVTSMSDLKPGSVVTGRVSNVTHFGAFTDIGVGVNGLIHSSKMGRVGKVRVGETVEVKVENIDTARNRIGLLLLKVM